jgi:hypothetical protein
MASPRIEDHLTPQELEIWNGLNSPVQIQAFLDQTPYSPEDRDRCPVTVMHDRLAHCLDGGLFAAAALRRIGYPAFIVDLLPDPGMDDDHVLAIYRVNGSYGAVAKSNFVGLRFREPIHRSLRELVLTYFEGFYSLDGIKTLRYYTRPFNLAAYDRVNWMTTDEGAQVIEKRLMQLSHFPLITKEMAAGLTPMDRLSYDALMTGANPDGIYVPGKKKAAG